MHTKKYFLSVLALFKNKSHILREWIAHYLKEGVDHFYLIDNGSTDIYVSVLHPFRDKISFYYDATPHNQRNMYMRCYDTFKNETEWLLVIDLDQFVYEKRYVHHNCIRLTSNRTIRSVYRICTYTMDSFRFEWIQ